MKEKKGSLIKQILCCILVLYLVFTAVPAIIHFAAKAQSKPEETGEEKDKYSQTISENSESPSELESSEMPPESTQNMPEEEASQIPGFLDDMKLKSNPDVVETGNNQTDGESDLFEIYDTATDSILYVTAEEFLPAAVVCEMPLTAPEEALKAQAVAAYTYYSWQRDYGKDEKADFTCNTADWQVYITVDQMKERWGEDFEANYEKIKNITNNVCGEILTAEGKAICSTYFAISNGSTEASENVWGGELPYLQTVASPGDKLSDGYLSTKTFSKAKIQTLLSEAFPEASFDFTLAEEKWFNEQQLSNAGYTKSILVCDVPINGTELRTALSLSSTSFTVEYDGLNYIFTVQGYGHGVGMSQVGAMFMAKQGSDYQEILSHYYVNSDLRQ